MACDIRYLNVSWTDLVEVGGGKYFIQHLKDDQVEPMPVKIAISVAIDEERGWWEVDQTGRTSTIGDNIYIPSTLTDGCKLWMLSEGYSMPLKEFLIQIGVLR